MTIMKYISKEKPERNARYTLPNLRHVQHADRPESRKIASLALLPRFTRFDDRRSSVYVETLVRYNTYLYIIW